MSSFPNPTSNDLSTEKALTEGVRRYCRSIELCDGYLRGYYGLKIVGYHRLFYATSGNANYEMQSTDRLLELGPKSASKSIADVDSFSRLPLTTVKALNEKSNAELDRIVRLKIAGDAQYTGYDEAEIISAKALLDGNSPST
jgi:hypothetical protein